MCLNSLLLYETLFNKERVGTETCSVDVAYNNHTQLTTRLCRLVCGITSSGGVAAVCAAEVRSRVKLVTWNHSPCTLTSGNWDAGNMAPFTKRSIWRTIHSERYEAGKIRVLKTILCTCEFTCNINMACAAVFAVEDRAKEQSTALAVATERDPCTAAGWVASTCHASPWIRND